MVSDPVFLGLWGLVVGAALGFGAGWLLCCFDLRAPLSLDSPPCLDSPPDSWEPIDQPPVARPVSALQGLVPRPSRALREIRSKAESPLT